MISTSDPREEPELAGFGERFRDIRVKLGLTQPELAKLLGLKRQTISSWEQGRTAPDVRALLQLKRRAREKGSPVDLGELLGEKAVDWVETPLGYAISLLGVIDSMGIRGVYRNRSDALLAFCPFLEREQTSINVVASSFLGARTVAPERVSALLREKASQLEFRILMTHPELSNWRETQEGRRPGTIEQEILESLETLRAWGVKEENIRFYHGAPTVFLIFTQERMLFNPYTYQSEAFKTVTFEVAPTRNPEDIYSQYSLHHFKNPWVSENSVAFSDLSRKPAPKRPTPRRETREEV